MTIRLLEHDNPNALTTYFRELRRSGLSLSPEEAMSLLPAAFEFSKVEEFAGVLPRLDEYRSLAERFNVSEFLDKTYLLLKKIADIYYEKVHSKKATLPDSIVPLVIYVISRYGKTFGLWHNDIHSTILIASVRSSEFCNLCFKNKDKVCIIHNFPNVNCGICITSWGRCFVHHEINNQAIEFYHSNSQNNDGEVRLPINERSVLLFADDGINGSRFAKDDDIRVFGIDIRRRDVYLTLLRMELFDDFVSSVEAIMKEKENFRKFALYIESHKNDLNSIANIDTHKFSWNHAVIPILSRLINVFKFYLKDTKKRGNLTSWHIQSFRIISDFVFVFMSHLVYSRDQRILDDLPPLMDDCFRIQRENTAFEFYESLNIVRYYGRFQKFNNIPCFFIGEAIHRYISLSFNNDVYNFTLDDLSMEEINKYDFHDFIKELCSVESNSFKCHLLLVGSLMVNFKNHKRSAQKSLIDITSELYNSVKRELNRPTYPAYMSFGSRFLESECMKEVALFLERISTMDLPFEEFIKNLYEMSYFISKEVAIAVPGYEYHGGHYSIEFIERTNRAISGIIDGNGLHSIVADVNVSPIDLEEESLSFFQKIFPWTYNGKQK